MPRKLSQEEVIQRCKEIHPEYSYDKLVYVNSNTDFIVTCPIHGDFTTKANRFIMGAKSGCPKCNSGFIKRVTPEEFKERCIRAFPDYDYSQAVFKGEYDKITVTCRKHNYTWEVRVKDLMNGHGCPVCGREAIKQKQSMGLEAFIQKAREIHGDKYDYSKVEYCNIQTPVTIICPKHGEFQQTPNNHLYQKSGCPKCRQSKGENEICKLLDKSSIPYIQQYPIEYDGNKTNKTYIDFYIPEMNIFIEYNGMQHYIPVKHFGGEIKFAQQVSRDNYVREYCKKNNINLVEIKYGENVIERLKSIGIGG